MIELHELKEGDKFRHLGEVYALHFEIGDNGMSNARKTGSGDTAFVPFGTEVEKV